MSAFSRYCCAISGLGLLALGALRAQEPSANAPSPSPSPAEAAAAAPPSDGKPIDFLDAAQLQKAIEILRRDHVRGGQVDAAAMTRATLRGLLETLSPGAFLGAAKPTATAESPFRSEILDGRAGYVRLGSLQSETIAQLDAALSDFLAKKVHGVVLDLRATPDSSDFTLAAQIASRFCPPGSELFSLTGPARKEDGNYVAQGEPIYRGPLVVIIDEETSGAAEALAATLRWNAKAMLVGERSSGRCVEFSVVPLAGDIELRIATSEVRVADQAIYPRGLRPDIEVAQSPEERETVLAAALKDGASRYVFEEQRAQMNEAALVAGTDPEIDGESGKRGPIDRPLQRATDLVTALRVFRRPG